MHSRAMEMQQTACLMDLHHIQNEKGLKFDESINLQGNTDRLLLILVVETRFILSYIVKLCRPFSPFLKDKNTYSN